MAFMIPQYYEGRMLRLSPDEEQTFIEPEHYEPEHHGALDPDNSEERGWFVELSAPGYLDRTGWSGPFATEKEARAECESTWDVDPDSGDPLPEA